MLKSIQLKVSSLLHDLIEQEANAIVYELLDSSEPVAIGSLVINSKKERRQISKNIGINQILSEFASFRDKEIEKLENVKLIESSRMEILRMKLIDKILERDIFPNEISYLHSLTFEQLLWLAKFEIHNLENNYRHLYEIYEYAAAYNESFERYNIAHKAISHYRKHYNSLKINRKNAFRCLVSFPFKNLDDDIPVSNSLDFSQDEYLKVGELPGQVLTLKRLVNEATNNNNDNRFNKIRTYYRISENPAARAA